MAYFMVDSDRVAGAATGVEATAQRIRTDVAAMMSDLVDLQNSWTGVAGQACAQLVAHWQTTQAQVEASLESIAQQLHMAASLYSDAEAQSLSLFASGR